MPGSEGEPSFAALFFRARGPRQKAKALKQESIFSCADTPFLHPCGFISPSPTEAPGIVFEIKGATKKCCNTLAV
jgi:hypothetical protein